MSNLKTATYALGCMYPSASPAQPVESTIAQLRRSGFTTVILSLFHIGRSYEISPPQTMGDIYFNDTLVMASGHYVGDPNWPTLVGKLIGGSVDQICASIGGGEPVLDFQTIQRIYNANGNSFSGTNLERNLTLLKQLFPSIGIIDLDCEDSYDQASLVAFCQMLAAIGFAVTFCPYTNSTFWAQCLQSLNTTNPGLVKWWNLQCYCGGNGNNPAVWSKAITDVIPTFDTKGFILPGDWTNDTPEQMKALLHKYRGEACVGGGFTWDLDSMIGQCPSNPLQLMRAYVNAVRTALGQSAFLG